MVLMEKPFRKTIFFAIFLIISSYAFAAVSAPEISSTTHQQGIWTSKSVGKFSWIPVDGAVNYKYQVTDKNEPSELKWKETNAAAITINNIGEGERSLFVRACDANRECGGAGTFSLSVDRTSPGPVSEFLATDTENGILISWKGASDVYSGIVSYAIYRSTQENFGEREFSPTDVGVKKYTEIPGTNFVDSNNLEPGISYYYKIQAFDAAGNAGILSGAVRGLNSNSACNFSGSLEIAQPVPAGTARGKILSNVDIQSAVLKIRLPGKEFETIFDGMQGTEIPFEFNVGENISGRADATLSFVRGEGTRCERAFGFDVNSQTQAIEMPKDENNSVKEEVKPEKLAPAENPEDKKDNSGRNLIDQQTPKSDNNWLLLAGAVLLVVAILFFYTLPKIKPLQKTGKKWPK